MTCALCQKSFSPEHQSPACPHLNLDPPAPRPGGPKLRPEVQREIEDAFNLRDKYRLTVWTGSQNFAARYYAQRLWARLEDLEKEDRARAEEGDQCQE